jgi:hypothetical protein
MSAILNWVVATFKWKTRYNHLNSKPNRLCWKVQPNADHKNFLDVTRVHEPTQGSYRGRT